MKAFMIVSFTFIAVMFFTSLLYMTLGWFRHFYHDVLEWHIPDESASKILKFSDLDVHCKCKYCGKDIMQDSQGNWF